MGCCSSFPNSSASQEAPGKSIIHYEKIPVNDKRLSAWKSTGIVSIRDSNLKSIPKKIFDLKNIRTLDATNNKICFIPDDIGMFSSLQRLIISKNVLEKLPPSLGALKQIKILMLDCNRLKHIPEEICEMSNLEKLSLQKNFLSSLPKGLGNLKKLMLLNANENKLEFLPSSIGKCEKMEEILANSNRLQNLPENITELKNLKTFLLDDNQISILPARLFSDCICLKTFSINGNPIKFQELENMLAYEIYEERRRQKVDKSISGNVLMSSNIQNEAIMRKT